MVELLHDLLTFIEQGGDVLWAILGLSILMWVFILERYLFFYFAMPRLKTRLLEHWIRQFNQWGRGSGQPWLLVRLREAHASEFTARLRRYLQPIRVLTMVLPLLGLLGTVSGMIKTFDALMLFGSGNVRAMATGISEALFTTMAGLVTALSGVYF
ncbi:MAG: MotA/TolQ/ExbB proton channel family protein, partial [Pseudomonadota bacterium]